MSCPACYGGGPCNTIQEINQVAQNATTPWHPEEIAQNILNVLSALGIDLFGMDAAMAVAAMDCQGCYTAPTDCFEIGYPPECSPPTDDEGYGVLQDTYLPGSPSRLSHSDAAYSKAVSLGAAGVFFPAGTSDTTAITPCTVVADPANAIAVFYFWGLTYPGNNCQTVGAWVGAPSEDVACAECAYAAYTGNVC